VEKLRISKNPFNKYREVRCPDCGSVNKYFFTSHNVNEQIVPATNSNRPGTPMNPTLQYVTIHDTASSAATATAKMHADYMTNDSDQKGTGWHYTVDQSSIYHHIPDLEHAWHAGDGSTIGGGNMSSIGIETCVNEGSDLYRTWQRTAKLVANLLVTHSLGVDDVRQHYDWSQKNCPQTMRNAGLWNNFMTLVQAEYDMLTKYNGYTVTFISNNTDLLDNTGHIIRTPLYSTDVTYTITLAKEGYTKSMTFHAVIPGKLSW
jgi:N-acetylmuramoyl-L-alanine amidase